MTMNVVVHMVAGAAAVAAAWMGIRRAVMHATLEEQYALIRDATSKLSATSERPATMVVAGLKGHGKSSFIDTLFRVLYREDGRPLITRALAIPPSSPSPRRYIVKNILTRYPKRLLHVIDLPGPDVLHYDAALSATNDEHDDDDDEWRPECVVLVMRTDECATSGAAWEQLPALVGSVRRQGLPLVVLMTHKRDAKNAGLNLKEVAKDVASRAGTDLVFCIDNYVSAGGSGGGNNGGRRVGMDMDTHCQTLSIVRQCLEFARQRRFNHVAVSTAKQPLPPAVAEDTRAPVPERTPPPPVVSRLDTTRVNASSSRGSMAAPIPECTPPAPATPPARASTMGRKSGSSRSSSSSSSTVTPAPAVTSDPVPPAAVVPAVVVPPLDAVSSDPATAPPSAVVIAPAVTSVTSDPAPPPALAVTSDPAPPPALSVTSYPAAPPALSVTSDPAPAPPLSVTSDPAPAPAVTFAPPPVEEETPPMEEETAGPAPAVVPAGAPMTTTPE